LSVLRKLYRLALASWDFFYSIVEVLITRPRTRAGRAAWLQKLCLRVMRSVDITYETRGPIPTHGAVISNHLTFFDIFLHSAVNPVVFISKIELRKMPLLGWISMMAGTVYVSRGGGGSALKAAEGMGKGFRDGLPVVFFPEGTTGIDNDVVMTFRSGLLAQAIMLDQPVTPVFIRYALSPIDIVAGKTVEKDFFWGPQTLPQLIWGFLGLHEIKATVTFGEPIVFSPEAIANRKIAAEEARTALVALSPTARKATTATVIL
jgi:lyso-ornithine lipid O-acyltransferase